MSMKSVIEQGECSNENEGDVQMKKYRLVTYKKECQGVPTDWDSLNALKITMEEHPEENCIYVIEEIECCGMRIQHKDDKMRACALEKEHSGECKYE